MKGVSKTYVLDTSILIDDPDIFYKLGGSQIVIPTAVIREIDGIKRNPDPDEPKARAARKVARIMDRLGDHGDISTGARTSFGSTVIITPEHTVIDALASNADNLIVGTAIKLKEKTGGQVILVSSDFNMRNVTRSYGITAENYPPGLDEADNKPKPKFQQWQRSVPLQIQHVARENPGRGRRKKAIRQEDRELPRGIILFAVLFVVTFILLLTVRR
jgi:rRNA maturation endonuclease Nob1